MSSPSIFILGVGSIINNWFARWLCSSLGVAQYLWVAGVVPTLVVYNMCDKNRLKIAAGAVFRLSADMRTIAYVLAVCSLAIISLYFKYVPWVMLAMVSFMYFVSEAFSMEKTMYMGDCCGAIAKQMFRKLALSFIREEAWMKVKGEWNFCSPYSRNLVVISTDHYYTLEKPDVGSRIRETAACEPPDGFEFDFEIENCEIFGKVEYLPEYRNGTEPKHLPNKIEVSLLYKKEPLEEYTFYNVPPKRVHLLKNLLEILQAEGNLLLSNFHRNVGSELKRAHARCYEFEELLRLVLSEGWTKKKVNLGVEHACSISGSSFPRGTATGLLVGLFCSLMCDFWNLSSGTSALVFAVTILLFGAMEVDILRLAKKSHLEIQSLLSSILPPNVLNIWISTRNLCF
ncbi:unnamed protein product [Calypogeia fissa]